MGNKKNSRIENDPLQQWCKRINWEKRIKAVCKPCWEIKYCPYGPLVERFTLKEQRDERSCRIFGHDCPVFFVAEPLTETKELRNISRSIPRNVQFKVLKRDNQICSECGSSVQDENIEFDHIIPWSKGGCSDSHNIRLLCAKCNKKRGNRFEKKYLVESLSELVAPNIPLDFIFVIYVVMKVAHQVKNKYDKLLTPLDCCMLFGRKKVLEEDKMFVDIFNDLQSFFTSNKPEDLKAKDFNALKYRWGFEDGVFHKLFEVSNKYDIDINYLLDLEIAFISRLGFRVKITEDAKKEWLKK